MKNINKEQGLMEKKYYQFLDFFDKFNSFTLVIVIKKLIGYTLLTLGCLYGASEFYNKHSDLPYLGIAMAVLFTWIALSWAMAKTKKNG